VDVDIWYTVQRAINIYDHWQINDLIKLILDRWEELRTDPERFVRERLADYVGIPPSMRNSWGEFWYGFWDRLAPDINQIRVNPTYWVTSKIGNALADVTEFLNDPIGKIVAWLNAKAEWFSGFLTEPWRKIVELARRVDEDVYQFLINPRGRLMSWLNSWLGLPAGFWSDPLSGFLDWSIWALSAKFALYRDKLYMRGHELLQHILEDEYW
jgi:hypothetical protein